jgi:hypothetical protein
LVYPKDAWWMPSHGTRRKQSPQVEVCFWNLESVTLERGTSNYKGVFTQVSI